jgi:hypothetical protein
MALFSFATSLYIRLGKPPPQSPEKVAHHLNKNIPQKPRRAREAGYMVRKAEGRAPEIPP